jgi:hypothetical protein
MQALVAAIADEGVVDPAVDGLSGTGGEQEEVSMSNATMATVIISHSASRS